MNRYHLNKEGRTAYKVLKGKEFNQAVLEFGEEVWFMKLGIVGKEIMNSRWEEGI